MPKNIDKFQPLQLRDKPPSKRERVKKILLKTFPTFSSVLGIKTKAREETKPIEPTPEQSKEDNHNSFLDARFKAFKFMSDSIKHNDQLQEFVLSPQFEELPEFVKILYLGKQDYRNSQDSAFVTLREASNNNDAGKLEEFYGNMNSYNNHYYKPLFELNSKFLNSPNLDTPIIPSSDYSIHDFFDQIDPEAGKLYQENLELYNKWDKELELEHKASESRESNITTVQDKIPYIRTEDNSDFTPTYTEEGPLIDFYNNNQNLEDSKIDHVDLIMAKAIYGTEEPNLDQLRTAIVDYSKLPSEDMSKISEQIIPRLREVDELEYRTKLSTLKALENGEEVDTSAYEENKIGLELSNYTADFIKETRDIFSNRNRSNEDISDVLTREKKFKSYISSIDNTLLSEQMSGSLTTVEEFTKLLPDQLSNLNRLIDVLSQEYKFINEKSKSTTNDLSFMHSHTARL